jgi:hypothetical protein
MAKRSRTTRWLVVSLLLHGALAVCLLFTPPVAPPPPPVAPVEVEIDSPPAAQELVAPKARGAGQRGRRAGKVGLGDLGVPSTARDFGGGLSKDGGDDSQAAWGAGGGEFERIADYSFMHRFYERVDAHVFYPAVLSRHRIAGHVHARVVLKGNDCQWNSIPITSTESHLRVLVLAILKEVCAEDLSDIHLPRASGNFDLSFEFALTEDNDPVRIEKQKVIVGNTLFFYRNSQHSAAQWNLGPFTGVFPIPAVSMDFDWLERNWDSVVRGKRRDEMREYREPGP